MRFIMAKTKVFIADARISYPALEEPRPSINGDNPRYEATFLFAPDSQAAQQLKQAVETVAREEFGPQADRILAAGNPVRSGDDREKNPAGYAGNPVRSGDDREKNPAGYAGNLYITARSKMRPDLRDSNPRIQITDPAIIKDKFRGGYHVNAYVEIFSYQAKSPTGAVIKSGVSAMLLGVQFKSYDTPFGGVSLSADDYPDETKAADASAQYREPEPAPMAGPAPAPAPRAPAAAPYGRPAPRYGAPASAPQGGYQGGGYPPADDLNNSDVPF